MIIEVLYFIAFITARLSQRVTLDAMQDTFVQLLRHEDRLDSTAQSSLLFRMATNTCLNKLRGEKRKPEDRDEALLLKIQRADPEEREGRKILSLSHNRRAA